MNVCRCSFVKSVSVCDDVDRVLLVSLVQLVRPASLDLL